jgi:hypothetical protein
MVLALFFSGVPVHSDIRGELTIMLCYNLPGRPNMIYSMPWVPCMQQFFS